MPGNLRRKSRTSRKVQTSTSAPFFCSVFLRITVGRPLWLGFIHIVRSNTEKHKQFSPTVITGTSMAIFCKAVGVRILNV